GEPGGEIAPVPDRGLGAHREHRALREEACERGEVRVVERAAAGDVIGEQSERRDADVMAVAGVLVQIGPTDGSGRTRLVDDDGAGHELALVENAIDLARGAIRAAAGTEADHDLDGLARLPLRARP